MGANTLRQYNKLSSPVFLTTSMVTQSMGAPPGLGGGPAGVGALFQNYKLRHYSNAPPQPPPGNAPPPRVSYVHRIWIA